MITDQPQDKTEFSGSDEFLVLSELRKSLIDLTSDISREFHTINSLYSQYKFSNSKDVDLEERIYRKSTKEGYERLISQIDKLNDLFNGMCFNWRLKGDDDNGLLVKFRDTANREFRMLYELIKNQKISSTTDNKFLIIGLARLRKLIDSLSLTLWSGYNELRVAYGFDLEYEKIDFSEFDLDTES